MPGAGVSYYGDSSEWLTLTRHRALEKRGDACNQFSYSKARNSQFFSVSPADHVFMLLFWGRKRGWSRRHPISRERSLILLLKPCTQTRRQDGETCLPYTYTKCRCWGKNTEKRQKWEHKRKFCKKRGISSESEVSRRLWSARQLSAPCN